MSDADTRTAFQKLLDEEVESLRVEVGREFRRVAWPMILGVPAPEEDGDE